MSSAIYLDHNATSPATEAHLSQVFEIVSKGLGNPSSPHALGRNSSVIVSESRKKLATALTFDVSEIVYVSGASEANNMGTVGVLRYFNAPGSEVHCLYSSVEHPSVREPLIHFGKKFGADVEAVPVDEYGVISLADLIKRIRPHTRLITVMVANNEVGCIQPVQQFANWLHERRWARSPQVNELDANLDARVTREHLQELHFHVDAVQALGKIPIEEWISTGIDSVAVSAHKIGGLAGIGALALRKGRKFEPIVLGGAQERNRRGGTENLVGITSFGLVASQILEADWWTRVEKCRVLRNELACSLDKLPGLKRNSSLSTNALPNTLHYTVVHDKIRGEDLLMQLDLAGIAMSSGSACSSGANLPSKILLAMGRTEAESKNSLRISLGHETSAEDVSRTAAVVASLLK